MKRRLPPDEESMQQLLDRLHSSGLDAVWVDRAPVFDKDTLLNALYQAIPLDGSFGFNWDALADVLFGPEDRSAPMRVLVFRDLELLEERSPETAKVFLDLIGTLASNPDSTLQGIVRAGWMEEEPAD